MGSYRVLISGLGRALDIRRWLTVILFTCIDKAIIGPHFSVCVIWLGGGRGGGRQEEETKSKHFIEYKPHQSSYQSPDTSAVWNGSGWGT